MNLSKIRIDGIPAILWGQPSDKFIIAAHGSHSSKIDDCIWVLICRGLILIIPYNEKWTISDNDSCVFIFAYRKKAGFMIK